MAAIAKQRANLLPSSSKKGAVAAPELVSGHVWAASLEISDSVDSLRFLMTVEIPYSCNHKPFLQTTLECDQLYAEGYWRVMILHTES